MANGLTEIIELIKKESPATFTPRPAHRRGGFCKHCMCFLSLDREQPTGFHVKNNDGSIVFVTVYWGKAFCRACHRFQIES